MRILPPRYTQVPNELLDNLESFSKAEIVILMALCRLTFGYHKKAAVASNARIAKMCGLATTTVIRNAQALADRGIITHEINQSGYSVWSIIITDEPAPVEPSPVEPRLFNSRQTASFTPAQESMYEKAKTLAEVTRMDFDSNKGMLLGHAKKLPISSEEIRDLFGPGGTWYRLDFRGIKGSPPALKQISTEFLKLKQAEIDGSQSQDGPSNSVVKDGQLFV